MKLKSLILSAVLACSLTSHAGNTKTSVSQVTEAVTLTTDVDYIITGNTPFTTTGSVNIENTEHAVLIINKVKPSKVISDWLSHIYINGEPAKAGDLTSNNGTAGSNCQVKMYNRGAIIMPYGQKFSPLTVYAEKDFQGESCSNYTEGHSGGYMKSLTTATMNNNFKSFKLKRGYMVTFALGLSGWGYSRCFIADKEDLEINLPANMAGRVSSYRLFKWWNAHKAGLASNGNYNDNNSVNSCWCYDWAQGNANNLPDVEWVPNHIYEDWPSSSTCGGVNGSCHMKTNNEPGNSADDHPQTVNEILNNWQNLMRTGMRLCSESSHDGSWSHLRAFIDSIDARGWRCDLLDLHCYWPSGSFNDIDSYYSRYGGRPIWISEWVWGASWNNNGAFAVSNRNDFYGNQNNTYNGTVPILEKLNASKYVERYAYWNSEADCSKILKNGELSKLGKYYASMDEGLGYNESIQKVPTIVYSNPKDLTGTYSKTKGSFTLTWNDINGDMLDSIVVQMKAPGTSIYTWVASVPLQDMNSKSGTTYSYTVYPNEGATYYRIAAYPIGNKTPKYSNETSVSVSSSAGTNTYQYGRLDVTNGNLISTEFSSQFSTTPAVFMGILTNANTNMFSGNVIKSPTKSKFDYQLMPSDKSSSYTTTFAKKEDIPFFAIQDTTNYDFAGLACEVGNVKINSIDTLEVEFRTPFPEGVTPIVITEYKFTSVPTNPLFSRIFDVTNKGFKAVSMYEEAVAKKTSLKQTLNYLAIQPGVGMLDEENGILIAAGIGEQLYGVTYRSVLLQNGEDTLYFRNPYIFGTLQSNNSGAAVALRRQSDITADKTSEYTGATYGTRIKRQTDATSSNFDLSKDKKSADALGWVVIANYEEGLAEPTAIKQTTNNQQDDFNIIVTNRRIFVPGTTPYNVYSVSGTKANNHQALQPGVYIVKRGNESKKVVVK